MSDSSDVAQQRVPLVHKQDERKLESKRTRRTRRFIDAASFRALQLRSAFNSFDVLLFPVSMTMFLASFTCANVANPTSQDTLSQYLVYDDDASPESDEGGDEIFEHALVNALVMISFICIITFGMLMCYKYDCNKCLYYYILYACFGLLFAFGGLLLQSVLSQYLIDYLVVDLPTFYMIVYNIAVVGVISVFYQRGVSNSIGQGYLVIISMISAWNLSQFPEYTTWVLLLFLSFWDLFAVLAPCGPLKMLVNQIEKKGKPLPGLLYEADMPSAHTQIESDDAMQRNNLENHESVHQAESLPHEGYYQQLDAEEGHSTKVDAKSTRKSLGNEQPFDCDVEGDEPSSGGSHKINRGGILAERRDNESHGYYGYEIEDCAGTIKLGLGDFVFFSVLCGRSAMFDFSTFVSSVLCIWVGLFGTMIFMNMRGSSMPALPMSLLLGVPFYFFVSFALTPMIDQFGSALAML